LETNRVKVEIFGQEYSINGDASAEYMLQIAEYVNKKMEEIGLNISNSNPLQVAILAALNITDEYFQLKKIKSGSDGVIEEKTRALISMLDEGLIGDVFAKVDSMSK